MASKAHRDPKVKRRQTVLRHLSRERDEWRCKECGKVSCPRGTECYKYSRFFRKIRMYYGAEDEKVPEEFEQWKQEFCRGGRRCVLRMHHVVQLGKGGPDGLDNVVTLCEECESKIEHES
jgi:hypothetical protein